MSYKIVSYNLISQKDDGGLNVASENVMYIYALHSKLTLTVTGGTSVTVTPASGTGSGSFIMSFAKNTSQGQVVRTAIVTSDGVAHNVYITQLPLEFSITPQTQEVAFNATTAEVTIYADEGQAWTATVDNGASLSQESGEGSATITVSFDANTSSRRIFTVSATSTSDGISYSASASIAQKAGPASPYTFSAGAFTINNNRTGSLTSSDDYVTVTLGNAAKSGNGTDAYLTMGYRGWTNNLGTIAITPLSGFKIIRIKITYSSQTYADYEWGNTDVTVNTGSYVRDSNTSTTATWTGSSEGTITFTNGTSANALNNGRFPRITSIEVTYEPV